MPDDDDDDDDDANTFVSVAVAVGCTWPVATLFLVNFNCGCCCRVLFADVAVVAAIVLLRLFFRTGLLLLDPVIADVNVVGFASKFALDIDSEVVSTYILIVVDGI